MMKSSVRVLVSCLGAMTLAACQTERAPETAEVATQGIPPAVKVTTTEQRHTVFVAAGKTALSEPERAGLQGFLSDVSPGNPEAVHVRLRGSLPPAQLSAVMRAAVGAGVSPSKIEVESVPVSDLGMTGGGPPGQPVEVVATVSRADFPTCPRQSWTKIGGADNPQSSNFGCASVTNLEAMVADPRDLVQGESGGQTDSQLTDAAIDRLRTDKVKRLTTTTTTSAVPSTGGGSQ